MPFELDDLPFAGRSPRKAQGGLIDFRSRATEPHAFGARNHLADETRRLGLDRGLARKQNALFDLRDNRIAQGLRTVAEDHRTHAEVVIDQAIAIDIMQIGAIPAFEYERCR